MVRAAWAARTAVLAATVGVIACGKGAGTTDRAAAAPASVESTTARSAPATESTARTRILFLGTSLTAGLGVDPDSSYPSVLQRMARDSGYAVDIINGGLSGETSAGALRRLDWLMSQPVQMLVIETGANDGLRGLDPDTTAANIAAIAAKARSAQPKAAIALIQMEAPPNLGPQYTARFHAVFPRVAKAAGIRLLPFLLEGVAGKKELNQEDGIHPTPKGARLVAGTVFRGMKPVLDSLKGGQSR